LRPTGALKIGEPVKPSAGGRLKLFNRKLGNFAIRTCRQVRDSAVLILINPREDFHCDPTGALKIGEPVETSAGGLLKLLNRKLGNFAIRTCRHVRDSAVLILINPREDFHCAPAGALKIGEPVKTSAGGVSKLFNRKLGNFAIRT
jgi:hypothetical protein